MEAVLALGTSSYNVTESPRHTPAALLYCYSLEGKLTDGRKIGICYLNWPEGKMSENALDGF